MNNPESLPYPGLRPFRADEGDIFYGRTANVDELLVRLEQNNAVFVIGPSGCGKSSLVRPGLCDALSIGLLPGTTEEWRFIYFRPEDSPLKNLAQALYSLKEVADKLALADVLHYLAVPNGVSELFEDCNVADDIYHLIIIDQFEEIFSEENARDPSTLRNFVAFITELFVKPMQRVYIAVTMRSDYLGDCTYFEGLPEVINETQYLVPLMTADALLVALTGPAETRGAIVDGALKKLFREDIRREKGGSFERGYDILPLAQHAMLQAWLEACEQVKVQPDLRWYEETRQPVLNVACYQGIGGLGNALNKHAEEIFDFNGVSDYWEKKDLQQISEAVFQRLTTKESSRYVRSPTSYRDLLCLCEAWPRLSDRSPSHIAHQLQKVLETFSAETCCFLRLQYSGSGTVVERVDIGHESLIRQWKSLSKWTEDEATSANFYRGLAVKAADYQSDNSNLLEGVRLQRARDWIESTEPTAAWAGRYNDAFESVSNYIGGSLKAEENQIEEEKSNSKREEEKRVKNIAKLASVAVVILVSAFWAWQKDKEGERALQQVIASTANYAQDPLMKALIVGELAEVEAPPAIAIQAAHDAAAQPRPIARYEQHKDRVSDVAYTPDRKHVITAGEDGLVLKCPSDGRGKCDKLFTDKDKDIVPVHSVDVSFDGQYAVTGDDDGVILLHDLRSLGSPREIGRRKGSIWDVVFSRNEEWLVSGGDDGALIRWSIDEPESRILQNTSPDQPIYTVALSSDDKYVASSGRGGLSNVWNVSTEELWRTKIIEGEVESLSFNSSSTKIVVGTRDGRVATWSLLPSDELNELVKVGEHDNSNVKVAKFHPEDDSRIVSGGTDGLRIWNSNEQNESVNISGGGSQVLAIEFDQKGKQLALGNEDGALEIWELDAAPEPLKHPLPDCQLLDLKDQAMNPGSARAGYRKDSSTQADSVTGICRNGTVWRVPLQGVSGFGDHELIEDTEGEIIAAALSSDGSLVATGNGEGEIRIRSVEGEVDDRVLNNKKDRVRSIAFDSENNRVVVAYRDGTILLWQPNSDTAPDELGTHKSKSLTQRIIFSPTNNTLASGGDDGHIRIWTIDKPGENIELGEKLSTVNRFVFSPDGEYLVSGHASGEIIVWPLTGDKQPLFTLLSGDDSPVTSVTYGPQATKIVSANTNGVLSVWDIESASLVFQMQDPDQKEEITSIDFTRDGEHIVTGGSAGTFKMWRWKWQQLIEYLSDTSSACLSITERRRYLDQDLKVATERTEECNERR